MRAKADILQALTWLRIARLQGGLRSVIRRLSADGRLIALRLRPRLRDLDAGWRRPEMAHFFAQNIIAPDDLFSEN